MEACHIDLYLIFVDISQPHDPIIMDREIVDSDDIPQTGESMEQKQDNYSSFNQLFGRSVHNSSEDNNLDEGISVRNDSIETQQSKLKVNLLWKSDKLKKSRILGSLNFNRLNWISWIFDACWQQYIQWNGGD